MNARPLWQRALILLLLVLGLVSIDALVTPAASWRGILSGEPGDAIYAAGFDGFEDEWQQYEGRLSAQIIESALSIKVDEANSTAYSAAQPTFVDFDVTVEATATDGPLDNGFGVIFRLQERSVSCNMPLHVLCDLSDIDLFGVPLRLLYGADQTPLQQGYYMFLISSDGYYSLWRGGERISTWIASDAINQGIGATNRIRIVGRGDHFQFFVNGQGMTVCIPDDPEAQSTINPITGECIEGRMLAEWTDDNLSQGKIGLTVFTGMTPGVSVRFDNFVVEMPRAAEDLPEQNA